MIFNPLNFYPNVLVAKNSPFLLLVRDCQCLLPSRKSNSVLPVFEFLLIVNRSKSARPGSPVTPRYLYNETFLSRFIYCLKRKFDFAPVAVGSVNDVSASILLVPGFCNCHNLHLEPAEYFLCQQNWIVHFILSDHFSFTK